MITFSNFTKTNACVIARKHSIHTSRQKNVHFDEAVIAKDVIHLYLSREIDRHEIPDIVGEAYSELSEISKQQELRERSLTQILMRYCRSEDRLDKVSFPEKKVISIPDIECAFDGMDEIVGGPDAVFTEGDTIELVLYKKGLPQISQSRGKQTVKTEIPLYLLIQYGKTLVKPGETKKLIASYYYLKKKTDKATSNYYDDFFDGTGGNIVYLEETYTAPDIDDFTPRPKSELDMEFEKQFEAYAIGYECKEDDCKNCEYNNICNYKKAPELQEKKEIKAKKKVVPSADQQKVIDAKEGYFKVNAGAGAGKTECISERFLTLVKDSIKESGVELSKKEEEYDNV